jgi:hypothetical protein
LLAVLLEIETQVEQRLTQRPFRTKQKRDEQTAQTPVAVEERMNGFKPDVHERALTHF